MGSAPRYEAEERGRGGIEGEVCVCGTRVTKWSEREECKQAKIFAWSLSLNLSHPTLPNPVTT